MTKTKISPQECRSGPGWGCKNICWTGLPPAYRPPGAAMWFMLSHIMNHKSWITNHESLDCFQHIGYQGLWYAYIKYHIYQVSCTTCIMHHVYHIWCIIYHVSRIHVISVSCITYHMYHVSRMTFHISCIMYHKSCITVFGGIPVLAVLW